MISQQISFNFSVAKVISILLVVLGHYFDGTLLWIPVTVALFVFAYSSAYFTTKKYNDNFVWSVFWKSKIDRLAIPFWVTQIFLLLLFLATGREGIWTWQTIVHWVGLSGWMNWFSIPNPSPFGAGLWFFTLLILFYLFYPVIYGWNKTYERSRITLLLLLILMLILQKEVKVGHELWQTAFGFWLGVYSARYSLSGSARLWFLIGAVSAILLLIINFLGIKLLNPFLLLIISVSVVQLIEKTNFSRMYFGWTRMLAPAVLEIYLIHTYLFVKNDWPVVARFLVSLILVIVAAAVLKRISGRIIELINYKLSNR